MKKVFMICTMAAVCLLGAQTVSAQDVTQMSAKELKAAHKAQKEKENAVKDAAKTKKAAEAAAQKAQKMAKKAEDAQKAAKKAAEKAEKAAEKAARLNGTTPTEN